MNIEQWARTMNDAQINNEEWTINNEQCIMNNKQ